MAAKKRKRKPTKTRGRGRPRQLRDAVSMTLTFDASDVEALERWAAEDGVSLSKVVRDLIREALHAEREAQE